MVGLIPVHFGHLPVWSEGNMYLNGAQPWKHEVNGLVNTEAAATVELDETNGRPVLKTNIYDILGSFTGRMIHSDLLGKAFEPEQRFENPDGTAITFNRDYFGTFRHNEILPGPFAGAADEIGL